MSTYGRNEPCHCGSGKKYKRCHEVIDQAARRTLMLRRRQAEVVGALLPPFVLPRRRKTVG